jgi:hypothetical protein
MSSLARSFGAMSSPFNTAHFARILILGCYECGAFSRAAQALVPWPEKQSLIRTFPSAYRRMSESQFHPHVLCVPKAVTESHSPPIFQISTKPVEDQVFWGVWWSSWLLHLDDAAFQPDHSGVRPIVAPNFERIFLTRDLTVSSVSITGRRSAYWRCRLRLTQDVHFGRREASSVECSAIW